MVTCMLVDPGRQHFAEQHSCATVELCTLCHCLLQALVRRAMALKELDDLEHALADAQRVSRLAGYAAKAKSSSAFLPTMLSILW